MRKSVLFFFLLIIVLLCVNTAFLYTGLFRTPESAESVAVWNSTKLMDYANMLVAKGLNDEAVRAYEEYLRVADVPSDELARVAYRLGQVSMELSEYQKALAAFYKAEVFDPKADFKADMDQQIIEALENLGMTAQARYELDARTSVQGTSDSSAAVVARIGEKKITQNEINTALDALPQWMREKYTEDDARAQFVREYVTQEVLFNKAKRLGLDKKAEVRDAIAHLQKQLLIQALLEREVGSTIDISPRDIELFYKAHKENYSEAEAVKVAYVKLDGDDDTAAREKLNAGEGDELGEWVERGATRIGLLGEAEDAVKTLFTKNAGEVTDPLSVGDALYIFQITEKRDERQKTFEEVKTQVEREVMLEEQQERMGTLIEKTLEEQEVEIFSVK